MNKQAIIGVNLGGWLLVERWMTPSLFDGIDAEDEYGLVNHPKGPGRIKAHRKTYISEEDWQWLSSHDISVVRLPVGYWALENDPPFINTKKELDWAFEMAEKYGIQILLDLHALKGSQNGTIHSGKAGNVEWQKYKKDHLSILTQLAHRYGKSPALWGLEIINEPTVIGHYFALRRFYQEAYDTLTQHLLPGTRIIFQDGFMPLLFSGVIRQRKGYPAVMDTHFYLLPGSFWGALSPKNYDAIRGWVYGAILFLCRFQQPVIVGEWSSVLPQAMFNREAQEKHLAMLGQTIRRQKKVYSTSTALFYWSYKAEGRGMYHYRSLVEDGII
jgi:glucan 1,3-beta-glucosidase